jgi:hypothetical protein
MAFLVAAMCVALLGLVKARPSAAALHCTPVVTNLGPGFSQATVLIVTGRTDCEKARRVIFKALSRSPYGHRQIEGWDCESTGAGATGIHGASCSTEGEKGITKIRSTVPKRCPGCHKVKD